MRPVGLRGNWGWVLNISGSINFNSEAFVRQLGEMLEKNPQIRRTLVQVTQNRVGSELTKPGSPPHEFSSAESLTQEEYNRDSMP